MGINVAKLSVIILVVACIAIISVCLYHKFHDNFESVDSNLDGKKYDVRGNYNDQQKKETANYLATISSRIDKLVDYMYDNKLPDAEISKRLHHRWNKCTLKETAQHENSAAYTVNKGDEMRICTRDGNGNIENMNTSMFVILHELGHLMSNSYGHNEEFRTNFSYITHLASSIGVYEPQEFANDPVNYCGSVVTINTSPCTGGTCDYTTVPTDPAYAPVL